MTTNPVAKYFDGVADVYDQVIPFFASFARQVVVALELPLTPRYSTWPPAAARSPENSPGRRAEWSRSTPRRGWSNC